MTGAARVGVPVWARVGARVGAPVGARRAARVSGAGRTMGVEYVEKRVEYRRILNIFSTSLDRNTGNPHFPQTEERWESVTTTDERHVLHISTFPTTTNSFK